MEELEHEMIAYTPEELLEIANREFAWCDTEWKRVTSRHVVRTLPRPAGMNVSLDKFFRVV